MQDHALERRAADRVGTVLREKYRIERVLGAGGMATVYAAVHRNASRVAIKVLHEELSVRGDMRARFLREGYVANMVGHPGAVRILDDDIAEDGSAFLVMELLAGETLRALCHRRGGRLACREVLALGHQLLDVLGAAHAAGIVHRDIKPENLFLTTNLVLKVLDFGIARIEDDPGALATATGTRLGTPAFMPPELALGRTAEVDGRTDLWSAGATLFQLLSGQVVHDAPGAAETVVRAATVPARSLAAAAPDVPPEVIALVDRALWFTRECRWPTARAMQEAIEEAHAALYGEAIKPFDLAPMPSTDGSPEALQTPQQGTTLTAEVERTRARGWDRTTEVTPPSSNVTRPTSTRDEGAESDRAARGPDSPNASRVSTRPMVSAAEAPGRAGALARVTPAGRRLAGGALLIVLTGSATLFFARSTPEPGAPIVPIAPIAPGAAAAIAPGPRSGCTTNQECVAAGGGKPFLCRKDDGVCVALETEQCRVLASPGDVENDATVWIGAMFPTSMPDPHQYGPQSGNAVELARRDFATMSGGLLPVRPGAPKRPIAVVLCDDREAPEPAARHLVNDVRVPAIIGFALSKEVMDLSNSLFNPKGVLALAANTASVLRDIPRSPSGERLVWRVTTSTDMKVPAIAAIVSGVIEPEIRAQPGALAVGEPIRAALVRVGNTSGQSFSDAITASLRINGKSVAENGHRFRLFESRETVKRGSEDDGQVAAQIVEHAPHVIIYAGSDTLSVDVERAWPREARFRPRHFHSSAFVSSALASAIRETPELRRRYYAVDGALPRERMTRFILRYNEVFTPKATHENATPAPYDAFYLFAYAAAALGPEPITGPALARALPRLLPGGAPIEMGPGGIYQAFYALAEGKNIDLQGIQTTLDFDLRTGDATTDIAAYCLSSGSSEEPPRMLESDLFFRPARGELEGALRCP